MNLLRSSQHRRMAWRNGGGHTLEVAISPPGAPLDDFDWRLSMATVLVSGPFSLFQQTDRLLAVLDGAMVLRVDGHADVTLCSTVAAHPFSGDAPAYAEVLSPVTDLNVMIRRGKFTASMRRLNEATVAARRGETFVLMRSVARLTTGTYLESNDVLRLARFERIDFEETPSDAWLIEITPLAPPANSLSRP